MSISKRVRIELSTSDILSFALMNCNPLYGFTTHRGARTDAEQGIRESWLVAEREILRKLRMTRQEENRQDK